MGKGACLIYSEAILVLKVDGRSGGLGSIPVRSYIIPDVCLSEEMPESSSKPTDTQPQENFAIPGHIPDGQDPREDLVLVQHMVDMSQCLVFSCPP